MLRTPRLKAVVNSLCAVVTVLALASPRAEAQVKPFKIKGGGSVDYVPVTVGDKVNHDAEGTATFLGRYQAEGKVQLNRFTSATTGEFSSAVPTVFTGANGDKLAFTYGDTTNGASGPGTVQLIPVTGMVFVAVWVAEFNPSLAQCTGRFKDVIDGSFIMVAITEPFVLGDTTTPVAYTWEGEGTIEFKKHK